MTDSATDETSIDDSASEPVSVHDLDLPQLDPEIRALDRSESTQIYRDLAKDHWIVRSVIGYSILHYDDVTAILRDKRWHNAVAKIPEMMGITDPDFLDRPPSILAAEGDLHTRLRRLVAKSFSPRNADQLRPFMREVVNELVDNVAASGHADIATDICDPYPIPIICELLGAPREDWELFSRWAEDVLRIFNGTAADELDVIKQAQLELNEYVVDMIAKRRDDPRDDLITHLIAAEEEGDRLSTEELVSMVNAVIVGGTDTTRNQLGCAVGLFAEHPDQWKLLAEQPDLAPRAVEEVMRVFGAVRGTGRFASEDIVYRNILFPAGTFVFPSLASANVDVDVVEDHEPLRFDITREPVKGRVQMTFGSGIHYCLGASLARAELQEALPILAQRMPDLAVDGVVTWKPPTTAIFGPDSLPVTFTPQ
ncbi:MAG: cytochrome P450 [Ilumatobacter sp.]|jgi:cytochrome P450|uniref:cytochrome P450 n=1 Tax=Ilumatobacter sp. TaxID=1967498 RepID=UPI00391C727B